MAALCTVTFSSSMVTSSVGLIPFWTHGKITSLLLLPLGPMTSSGQLVLRGSYMCHFWAKALDSETLHSPPCTSSITEVCVEMEGPWGRSSLLHWANHWKSLPDPQPTLGEWKINVYVLKILKSCVDCYNNTTSLPWLIYMLTMGSVTVLGTSHALSHLLFKSKIDSIRIPLHWWRNRKVK